ncbi:hypothetical protein [Ostreibacterium oceani]|uniref:Antirepressor protein ant N-terminal domain-containing protein n=1 Tax=Ostreibacterium oceani TaxID=2654998 RepID=A0A6N7F4S3_9GAMM|nr:hypothetical protein [Ostreibacterium oceani]MPV86886.1 hypothetical protein [Ostreibacterium oceani]
MTENTKTTVNIVGLFEFHGLILPVLFDGQSKYIPIKPIADLVGLDWRSAKKTISNGYKSEFFQYKAMKASLPSGLGGDITPLIPCILLEKVHFYIAQINPDRISANGNIEAAQRLILLHNEWAAALYEFETQGFAIKKDKLSALKELMRLRNLATGHEVAKLTEMIKAELQGVTVETDSAQQHLPLH